MTSSLRFIPKKVLASKLYRELHPQQNRLMLCSIVKPGNRFMLDGPGKLKQ
jgi:hypothetical protein